MDLIQWFHLISENALQTVAQIEQLAQGTKQSSIKLLPILEQNQLNLNHTSAVNNIKILFTVYALVAICIKRPQLLAAFFVSCLLFESSFFDVISESHLYLITFIIYSYVITCNQFNNKTKLACVIMCLLCLVFAYDAAFYGIDGFYGESKTFIWHNIERFAICCHILIICTTVDVKRISNAIKSFCYSISDISRNSATFTIL